MNQDRTIRRLQVALYSRGEGVILFSLWSGIEVILLLFSSNTLVENIQSVPDYSYPTATLVWYIAFFGILVLFIGGNLALNIYIGRSAIAFSRGNPIKRFPLVWCGLYSVFYAVCIAIELVSGLKNSTFMLILLSAVLDTFVAVIHIQIIVFSHRLKKARI